MTSDQLLHMTRLAGVAPLRLDYDAWLCDIWGVVHNGVKVFDTAVFALQRFREEGGVAILISNAPRPGDAVRMQLDALGVDPGSYDAIVTSGDVTRALIEAEPAALFLHIGPERDAPLFEGLDVSPADIDEAEFILCTGLFDDETETPENYLAMLDEAIDRGLTMICANPDLVVQRGDRQVWCAGALAALYEQMGGAAVYAGKPHAPIYERAIARIAEAQGREPVHERILAIGDNLNTDFAGAAMFDLDALFIANGVHMEDGVHLLDAAGGDSDEEAESVSLEIAAPEGLAMPRIIGFQRELSW